MTEHHPLNVFTYDTINTDPISKVVSGSPYTPAIKSYLEWTPVSKDLRKSIARNDRNMWIDLVSRFGTGFINIMIKNLTLLDILELMCTSRRLSEIICHYIYMHDVSELTTRITDIDSFFKSIPHAKSCNHSGVISVLNRRRPYLERLPANLFEGRQLISLDLSCRDMFGFNPEIFKGIKVLRLNRCTNITNELFRCVQGIETLEMENVDYPNIDGEAFAYFVGIKSLSLANSYLGCNNMSFVDTREMAFSFLQGIERLNMTDIEVNDTCLQYVAGAKSINISQCTEVTDVGIGYITEPGTLEELNISNCGTGITVASHDALKTVPILNMNGCHYNMENCPICMRERRIDRIQEHLEKDCDTTCTLCNDIIIMGTESYHLNNICTMNFFECTDCHHMIMRKNKNRHTNRCSERMITCNVCSDHVPYSKKDRAAHVRGRAELFPLKLETQSVSNVHVNYEAHEVHMSMSIKTSKEKIQVLQPNIDLLEKDLPKVRGYNYILYKQKQENLITLMRTNIHSKRCKYMKQLYVECNMMEQSYMMRLKQARMLRHIIEEIEREEEYDRGQEEYDDWRLEEMWERRRDMY
jgi:hypothetical protein